MGVVVVCEHSTFMGGSRSSVGTGCSWVGGHGLSGVVSVGSRGCVGHVHPDVGGHGLWVLIVDGGWL